MDVNQAFSQLGSFGLFQFYVYAIALFPQTIAGLIFFSTVFISSTPDYRCLVDGCESKDRNFQNIDTFSSPLLYNSCKKVSAINRNNTQNCSKILISDQTCDQFVYSTDQFQSTIVTEWDIVCDNSWKLPLSQSIFMLGILLGVLVNGYLADRFGRKSLFIFLPIVAIASNLLTAFAPNFPVFAVSTCISAYAVVGMSQTSYIIGIEFIGAKYRVICANLTNILFASGALLLCLIAYFIRDWRQLQFAITVPFFLTLFYYWFFPESVRWQVSNGQLNRALMTIRRAAKLNGVVLNEQLFVESKDLYGAQTEPVKKYGPLDIIRHPITRIWTLNLAFVWITNSIIYFGLTFQASKLGSNTYLTFALLSAVDIPLIMIASASNQFYGRKRTLICCFLLASIACICTVFVPHSSALFTCLAILGKSSISASFAVVYIYSVELYPTFLRSTGLGICSMISRVGGILAPFLIKLSVFGEDFPLIFCGVIALIAGLLTCNLPETLGKELPEDFADIEKLKNNNRNKNSYSMLENKYNKISDRNVNERTRLLG